MGVHSDAHGAWLDAYVEDQKTAAVEPVTAALAASEAARSALQTELAQANEALAQANQDLADSQSTVGEQATRIAALEAEVARLEEELANQPDPDPDPDPEPEPHVTRFGSCPVAPGGESLSAARTVTTKWGDEACVRQFKGNFSAPNAVGSLMHTSYKPDIDDLLAGRLDSQIVAVVNAARPGDVLEVWHEADKKAKDGLDTYERYVAAKNYFYDKVKSIRSDVLVANTVTGWLFEPTRTDNPDWERWGAVRADILGIDCDGIHPTRLPYTDYRGETERARTFIARFKANGYRFYAVPEYGSNRISTDTNGVERAKAYTAHGEMWAADPLCLYVALYEYDKDSTYTYRLTTSAELEAWRALI